MPGPARGSSGTHTTRRFDEHRAVVVVSPVSLETESGRQGIARSATTVAAAIPDLQHLEGDNRPGSCASASSSLGDGHVGDGRGVMHTRTW